mmetsp:Transcript_12543/g.18958  ORF Transcript_12543/g.18958 Transcript_12543/m.18958 type:complete len:127 (-) Transcript_12543:36-416(-)
MANREELEKLVKEVQNTQSSLQSTMETLSSLRSAFNENSIVLSEFKLLDNDPSATVYKLVGCVLVKQDRKESLQTVEKRISYLTQQIKETEKRAATLQQTLRQQRSVLQQTQASRTPQTTPPIGAK